MLINIFYSFRFWIKVVFNNFNNDYDNSKTKDGYELTFEDNFDLDHIDWNKWNKWWSEDGNDPDKSHTKHSLDCLVLDNNHLHIVTKENTDDDNNIFPLKSGYLFSAAVSYYENGVEKNKGWEQMFGYFEIRCKPPKQGRLLWPAFWLWNNTWPPEIDIFEFMSEEDIDKNYTKGITFTSHWGYDGKKNSSNYFGTQLGKTYRKFLFLSAPKWNEHFHVYACKWTPFSIKWYIDDICVYENIYNIPTTEMSILISTGPSIDFEPSNDPEHDFVVDYVRAYQKTDN